MKKTGTVVAWQASRGFGLIRSPGTKGDVIFRGRDFDGTPAQGLAVEYDEVVLGGRAVHAMSIRIADTAMAAASPRRRGALPRQAANDDHRRPSRKRRGATPVLIGMVAWFGLFVGATVTGRMSVPVLIALPMFNLAVFFLYWHNKFAASKGGTRLPEDLLHLLAALGGWPGAWFAQRLLRYKPVTPWFARSFWSAVVVNVAASLGWLFLG